MRRLLRPVQCVWLLAGMLALVACVPVPVPPDPPEPLPPQCTASQSSEYVAVVDVPGSETPDIVEFSATNEEEKAQRLDDLEDDGRRVVSVEPDQRFVALDAQVTTFDEPNFASQWGLRAAKFDVAWAEAPDHLNGTGQTIAVADSGVQANHPDLGTAKVLPGIDEFGIYADGRTDPNGHGTHVAGIAAAGDNGLGGLGGAPGAAILPVRVLNADGVGSTATVANGINWAADNGATVINLSLVGECPSTALQLALNHANSLGVTVVAAGGNCGAGGFWCGSVNQPAYPAAAGGNVIAAAATDSSGGKAWFSNSNGYLDIAGPGLDIYSTLRTGDYGNISGTSMATPFVAAAAALLREHCPEISPTGVFSALTGNDGPQIVGLPAGVGLVNADALVTLGVCPA